MNMFTTWKKPLLAGECKTMRIKKKTEYVLLGEHLARLQDIAKALVEDRAAPIECYALSCEIRFLLKQVRESNG